MLIASPSELIQRFNNFFQSLLKQMEWWSSFNQILFLDGDKDSTTSHEQQGKRSFL